MKLLAFADLHLSDRAFSSIQDKVKQMNPDAIICAGDYTIFGHDLAKITKKIAKIGLPVFLVHGNHEEGDDVAGECAKHSNVHFIHRKVKEWRGYTFIGYGGGGFSFKYPDFDAFIKENKEKFAGKENLILVAHAPPYGTNLDDIFGSHVGSKTFIKFIKKHKQQLVLSVSGHIHECMKNTSKIGNCVMVNPGADGMLIEL